MAETITVEGEGLTLELLLWRRYGIRGRELVTVALERNPGLATLGPVLPPGTKVMIPDLPSQGRQPARKVVSLFG